MTMILRAYANLMCHSIWFFRRFFPAGAGEPLVKNHLERDWEWTSDHQCEVCGHKGKHRFIEYIEGANRVVTATCPKCLFEGTLP